MSWRCNSRAFRIGRRPRYHRAAGGVVPPRRAQTLDQIGEGDLSSGIASLGPAVEALLSWRDNGLQEMEDLLVKMLAERDRWMQEFWLRDFAEMRGADWDALRASLERPFARAVAEAVNELDGLLDEDMRDEAMDLARFSCGQRSKWQQCKLFQFAGLPCQPFRNPDALEEARQGLSLHGANAAHSRRQALQAQILQCEPRLSAGSRWTKSSGSRISSTGSKRSRALKKN